MIDALVVTWQSLKDLWEDFVLLIMLNLVWSLALLLALAPVLIWGGTNLGLGLALSLLLSWPLAIVSGALCFVTNQIVRGKAVGWATFATGLRRYWSKSLAVGLINLAVLLLLASNIQFYAFVLQGVWANLLLSIWVIAAIYWLIAQIYWYPMVLELESEKVLTALRNALVLVIISPGFSLTLAIILLALVVLCTLLTVPLVLFMVVLLLLIMSRATRSRLAILQARHESRKQDGGQKQ